MLTHIAGPAITISGYRRQRCSWCGTVIDEVDLTRVAVACEPDEQAGTVPTWPEGQQVRTDGNVLVGSGDVVVQRVTP